MCLSVSLSKLVFDGQKYARATVGTATETRTVHPHNGEQGRANPYQPTT